MIGWDMIFNRDTRFAPNTAQSPEWNRGAYLTEALAHCGDCHTPRNVAFAIDNRNKFAGAVTAGWRAFNITSDKATGIGGWREADLASYLASGHATGHGTASGPMGEAVDNSFRYLVPEDIIHRTKQPYRAPDAASFFVPGRPAWFDEITSERAVAAAGVFKPSVVAGLLAKCRRTGGENMSNTDNMRVLAIVSSQLTHDGLISGGGQVALDRPLPEPSVAADLVTDDRSMP